MGGYIITPGLIPSTVVVLISRTKYFYEPGVIPSSVRVLQLRGDTELSKSSTELLVGVIPTSVTSLAINDDYPISKIHPGAIPTSVTDLYLGLWHGNSLLHQPGVLPESITQLTWTEYTKVENKLHPGVLPSSLTNLTFWTPIRDDKVTPGSIPSNILTLKMQPVYGHGIIPSNVTDLCFTSNWSSPITPGLLPNSVTRLDIGKFNTYRHDYNQNTFPLSLTQLKMNVHDSPPPGALPASLTELDLGLDKNGTSGLLVGSIPPLVKVLFIRGLNQTLVQGLLPNTLEVLDLLTSNFNHPITVNSLPPSLKRINLGEMYNHPFPPGVLPNSLTSIRLGFRFVQLLEPGSIPQSLTHLALCGNMTQSGSDVWPRSIKHIELRVGHLGLIPPGRHYDSVSLHGKVDQTDQEFIRLFMSPSTRITSNVITNGVASIQDPWRVRHIDPHSRVSFRETPDTLIKQFYT
ncbi:hypothetical protein SAMD00019534_015240 [Acytostelium subglobosum LB1]|uniref:hypothetical protein n=1 Tax=Acytostelium subglobosum LB1 TaxID=1410327 RepID=UPI000644D5F8|nr:hypothetical protein SAMD00019534_015240 [Acytostelium subglobosum LB1]GAM18349.1 hypothetical protein SAMD00019534_015240 [Acytostelium subglobosum LB1]|eukprot:XP_012757569.1 hypothetical protein SAMD00019534_015240 [Acytostelium subglobosum LB1]